MSEYRRVWAFRELLRNLVIRELKVRYRNSVLGFVWSLLNPLLMMVVFSFVFSVLFRVAPATVPYPAFLLVGFLPWLFFSTSVMAGAWSIVGNAALVTRINFPREILTMSSVLSNAVNLLLATVVLLPVLVVLGIHPSPTWLLYPVIFAPQALFVMGIAFVAAASNVFFRDTAVILEVLLQAWLFLTPVFYDVHQIPREPGGIDFSTVIELINPMALYITLYRSVLLGIDAPTLELLIGALVMGGLVCAVGYATFHSVARRFGDLV